MLHYRAFQNTDPPIVAALWQSRGNQPGLLQPVSVDLLEQCVFGKLHFDYQSLFLAWDGDCPVGFGHASFGPDATHSRLAADEGVTCVVMVRPECRAIDEVASGLLDHCEQYLLQRGAKRLYGGCVGALRPFYLGLYGGCEMLGVCDGDAVAQALYSQRGYEVIDHSSVFRRRLDDFRPKCDRRRMQWRRRLTVRMQVDPLSRDWWEACTTGDFDLIRFEATERTGAVLATATVRAMESTLTAALPGRIAGLIDLEVTPTCRRQGLATYLLAEAYRELAEEGFAVIETMTPQRNTAAMSLFERLGMEQAGRGTVFCREV